MSGVAIAIGGAALVGAGAGVGGSIIQSSAAKNASAGALSQMDIANWWSQQNLEYIKSLYQPFINVGTSALSVLQGRTYTTTERKVTNAQQRMGLVSKIEQLSKPTDWNTFPIQVGEKASERRAALFTQAESERMQQLDAAKAELALFDKQQGELAPLYAQQDAENQKRLDRISTSLDQIAKLSNIPSSLADIRSELQNDPVYQFRLDEGNRAINRAAAARGTFFSGKAIEELGDFSLALTGEETDKYLQRKLTSLTAATAGLNSMLAEDAQSSGQALSLAQLGLGAVQGTGAAVTGQTQTQATLASQAAQTQMQGTLAQGQAIQQGLGSVANAAGGVAALSLFAKPKADTTSASFVPGQGGTSPQGPYQSGYRY